MKDFKNRSPLLIFLSYFKRHRKLFALDMICAIAIAGIDLLFPLITRTALHDILPKNLYNTFFVIIAALIGCYLLRSVRKPPEISQDGGYRLRSYCSQGRSGGKHIIFYVVAFAAYGIACAEIR